jgi:hypothetical protein
MQASDSIGSVGDSSPEPANQTPPETLQCAAADSSLTEDLALAFLQRGDLPPDTIEQLSKNSAVAKSRKVKLAIVGHAHTPRYVSMALVRQMFTFDLMQVGLTPTVPADVKVAADEVWIHRMDTISSGERLAMARRASGRIAAQLLSDTEERVMRTALDNGRLTEIQVVRALNTGSSAEFVMAVCGHPKWSVRRDVGVALLRNPKTPLHKAVEIARALPAAVVRDVLHNSQLPALVKEHVLEQLARSH